MIRYYLLILVLVLTFPLRSQEIVIDSLGSFTFTSSEGDTTYLMKQYFMVFIESIERSDQSEEASATFQAQHLAYLESLVDAGIGRYLRYPTVIKKGDWRGHRLL